MECNTALLERLLQLAKLKLGQDELEVVCRDLFKISEYLRRVSQIPGIDSVEPLYHVWEEESRLLEDPPERRVDVRDLPTEVLDGYVKVPWRGGSK